MVIIGVHPVHRHPSVVRSHFSMLSVEKMRTSGQNIVPIHTQSGIRIITPST